jgi:UDP-glucose 4-epimerase
MDYVILRYMNVYGPRQDAGLVRLVLNRINSGQRPIITGDGSASFDFVHVGDVAEANVRSMASDLSALEINVGSGGEASVKEIVGRLLRLTGSDLEPEYRPAPNSAMFRRVGSNERMVKLLGWQPELDLDAGLKSVIDHVAATS